MPFEFLLPTCLLMPSLPQVFLKKLSYTQDEIDEFMQIADNDGNGEVRGISRRILADWTSSIACRDDACSQTVDTSDS
jgi:hypothetical protein